MELTIHCGEADFNWIIIGLNMSKQKCYKGKELSAIQTLEEQDWILLTDGEWAGSENELIITKASKKVFIHWELTDSNSNK